MPGYSKDVAARGLDIPEVDLVIQCEPPKVSLTLSSVYYYYQSLPSRQKTHTSRQNTQHRQTPTHTPFATK